MKNRPLGQGTLHAAEGVLGACESGVDPPRFFRRKILPVAAQQVAAIETRRHLALRFIRFILELPCLRIEGQCVIARHPRIALLEPPNRLTDLDVVLEPPLLDSRLNPRQIPEEAFLLFGTDRAVLLHSLTTNAQN